MSPLPEPFEWKLTTEERAAAIAAVNTSRRAGLWRFEDACKAVAKMRRQSRHGFTNEHVIAMEDELLEGKP